MYWNFYSSLGDRELLYFVRLPLRGERGNWKKITLSLLWKMLLPSTRRHSVIKQTRPSTKQDFSGEALSKQNTEASLSCNSSLAMTEFMQLVPGADRVVRHICIRCMASLLYFSKRGQALNDLVSWHHGNHANHNENSWTLLPGPFP